MKTDKRLERIEQQIPANKEPQFYHALGDEWTEEQKAEALRKHPDCTFFWKTLSSMLTVEEIARRKAAGESLVNQNSKYIALGNQRS